MSRRCPGPSGIGSYLAVHHRRRRDDVSARLGLAHGRPGQQLQGRVVVDAAIVDDEAAVAVVGVLAEADVRNHGDIRGGLLDDAHGLLDYPIRLVGLTPHRVLVGRYPEEEDGGYVQLHDRSDLGQEAVERQAVHARHRPDFLLNVAPVGDEDRVYEVGH